MTAMALRPHSFGPIDAVMFFGAGTVLTRTVQDLLGAWPLCVVTGPRLLGTASHDPGVSLERFLATRRVRLEVCEDVNDAPQVDGLITKTTLGISLGAPWMFRARLIEAFRGRLINSHYSRLPQDRGGGGFSWRIMRGQRMGGETFHLVTEAVDAGPIVKSCAYTFPPACATPAGFQAYAAMRTYRLLAELLAEIARGQAVALIPQDERRSSYWPRLNTEQHAYVDWSWGLQDIERFIQAFDDPYAGAATFMRGQRVRLKQAAAHAADGTFHPFQSGLIYRVAADHVVVAAREGSLVIRQVLTDEGRSILPSMRVGDRLYTPAECLEQARRTRVFYSATGLAPAATGAAR